MQQLSSMLGRSMEVFYQRNDPEEANALALVSRADRSLAETVRREHREVQGRHEVRTVNWFVPEIQNPFYGGIHTVFRLADHLAVHHGVENRFMVMTGPVDHDERWYRSGITAAFESLSSSPIIYHDSFAFDPEDVPPADAAIATMWTTAYFAARTPGQVRRFYLIQDYEPMFYPAGTLHALAEHTYRMGLYGLCNTAHLADIYRNRYGGVADHFWPAIDEKVFHARGRLPPDPSRPVNVFVYARPGHTRNCWELAAVAMRLVKEQLANQVPHRDCRVMGVSRAHGESHHPYWPTRLSRNRRALPNLRHRYRPHRVRAPFISPLGADGVRCRSGGARQSRR